MSMIDDAGLSGSARAAVEQARGLLTGDGLGLRRRSLLSVADLNPTQFNGLVDVAQAMSAARHAREEVYRFDSPRAMALIFEKPSLRTRVTFELAFQELGGHAVVLGPTEIGLGTRESVPDVARNLERWVDVVTARVFAHSTLEGLRDYGAVPVVNALCDHEHPCQALADVLTLRQHRGSLDGMRLAWVGDGNNVLHSLMLACVMAGADVVAACPAGYAPDPEVVSLARKLGDGKRTVSVVRDPADAVDGADAIYTDVWTSMGQEAEKAQRDRAFAGFQVTAEMISHARPDALFMHCLPAHRGSEVADEVIDGPQSVVFDQAENRLHAQKAVLAAVVP